MKHITKNGEITSQNALIDEIENLLNRIPSANKTHLSSEVMSALNCTELEQIRDNLLKRDCIEQNLQWLLNLTQSDDDEKD